MDYEYIYDAIQDKKGCVYAMEFSAVEDYETASSGEYKDHIADFELMTSKDADVLLLGNYGTWGTLGRIERLEGGRTYRVLKEGMNLEFDYPTIVNLVQTFQCAAIPISKEVVDAAAAVGISADEFAGYKLTEDNTKLTLSLNLYDPDTGKSQILGNEFCFIYHPLTDVPLVSMPQTGDSSNVWLWLCAGVMSAVGFALVRRKNSCCGN